MPTIAPSRTAWVIAVSLTFLSLSATAGDVTWSNGSGDFIWNTTSTNWSSGTWDNAGNNAAVFTNAGSGAITVPGSVTVRSLDFQATGYTLNGSGPLNFTSAGTGTLGAGVVSVATGATATLNTSIASTTGLQKLGAGVLELGGTNSISGAYPITANGSFTADVVIGQNPTGFANGGTLRLLTPTALANTTTVGIGNGYLDIGANAVTLANLRFTNQQGGATSWNTTLNANNGVVGSGTLRVTGEITVNGINLSPGGNAGNTIAANLDLGGGTQVVRVGRGTSFGLSNMLMLTGTVSNGSLLKTLGPLFTGSLGGIDGMSLFGNNTYTGSTVLNGGNNLATGTNASTLLKIVNGQHALQGANGSYLSAGTIQVYSGGALVLDNNAALIGNNNPSVAAAQNNDRIRDDASVELRDGSFIYRGLTNVAATETFGKLTVSGGSNTLTVASNGTGTATVTVANGLNLAPRATLLVNSVTGVATQAPLGTDRKVFVNGALPAADPTGLLTRVYNTNDFVTYSAATGITPYTGYAANTYTAGANVALTAASTAPTVSINALKTTGTFTTTIGAGNTLTVTSGMILNTSGTNTITGGTLDFGATPGAILGTGSNTVASAVTGTGGLIVASGTNTFTGNLSGLSGPLTLNSGTTNLNTNTFAGPIEVRVGTLNLGVSQTGGGAITLGVPQNDVNLLGAVPTLSLSAAGANATFSRDIISDNGATNAAGITLINSYIPLLQPLSNSTGSQTISGNIILNTALNLQGGGATGAIAGSTNFTGAVSGAGTFYIPNGRFSFTGAISNSGGFVLGGSGFTMIGTFASSSPGGGTITINGGSNSNSGISYQPGGLPTGTITIRNASGTTAPTIIPLATSTINNAIVLNGDVIGSPATGVTGTWGGLLSGTGTLTKSGAGTLVLSNTANTHTGAVAVNAGTLLVNGNIASSTNAVTVNSGGTLGGTGAINRTVTVVAGGTLNPGASIGTVTVNGTTTFTAAAPGTGAILAVEAARGSANTISANDQLAYNGNLNFAGLATGTPAAGDNKFRINVISDATNPLVFGETYTMTIARLATGGSGQIQRNGMQVNTTTYTFDVNDYQVTSASFSAFNDLSLTANPDGSLVLVFTPVPEPATVLAVSAGVLGGFSLFRRWRRRADVVVDSASI